MKIFNLALPPRYHGVLGSAFAAEPPQPVAAPETATVTAPLVDPAVIDSALTSLIDSKQIVGVSALVYERGKEAYFGAFGFADRENDKPMARDTSCISSP